MSHTRWLPFSSPRSRRPTDRAARRSTRFRSGLQTLEGRKVPAVTAIFNPGLGTLTVLGDGADNTIDISRDALGVIRVNGEVPLAGGLPGGFPSVFNTRQISVFGLAGNDSIRLDETNGPLPAAQLFGGSGADLLVGGSGDDDLHGQDGDDQLIGGGGADFLLGQSGDDVISGGDGDDQMFGGSGDDTIDGGSGADVLLGGVGDDVLSGGAGADVLFVGGGDIVVLGGAGDDVLCGEEGDDVLDGGTGDDILLGGEVVFDD